MKSKRSNHGSTRKAQPGEFDGVALSDVETQIPGKLHKATCLGLGPEKRIKGAIVHLRSPDPKSKGGTETSPQCCRLRALPLQSSKLHRRKTKAFKEKKHKQFFGHDGGKMWGGAGVPEAREEASSWVEEHWGVQRKQEGGRS